MTDHDPYRIPPTTGPATRTEKLHARLNVKLGHVAPFILPVISLFALPIALAGAVHQRITTEPSTWLIECPGREPWESPLGYTSEGRTHAQDQQGRPIALSSDCMVTTIKPDAE